MKISISTKKGKTILWRIMLPLVAIILIQPVLYAAAFGVGGVFSGLKNNALSLFDEKTSSRMMYLQNEMSNHWSNLDEEYPLIKSAVKRVLASENARIKDIKTNAGLNEKICRETVPLLLDVLRKNGTNGAYLILNGTGADDVPGSYAGVFLRDRNPANFSVDNGEVTLVRGITDMDGNPYITFDTTWKRTFVFNNEQGNAAGMTSDFFFKPIGFASQSTVRDADYFGYWSRNFKLDNDAETANLSYSIPLIYDDGTVYGVMGVEITPEYLSRYLPYEELTDSMKGAYLLAVTTDGGTSLNMFCSNGSMFDEYFGNHNIVKVKENYESEFVVLDSNINGALLGCPQYIELYSHETPYANENWLLMGIAPRSALLDSLYRMEIIFASVTALVLLVSLMTAFLTAVGITKPIGRLVAELKKSDPHKPIHLRRIQITEIDELSESIESLSQSVEASASRISKIITMSGIPLGVYEFQNSRGEVFCSKSLFDVLGWNGWNEEKPYIDMREFRSRFRDVLKNIHSVEQGVYQVTGNDGVSRWVKIKSLQEGERTLGAILDVTRDIEEKMKIEYERDYDILTNLYNRFAFGKTVEIISEQGDELIKCAAMIMMDLDNLKYVNDRYGHDCGDKYIQALAKCLEQFLQHRAVVGRRSGDEFFVFIYGYETQEEVRHIINEVWDIINAEYIRLPNGEEYKVRVSAGIAWYGKDSDSMKMLIQYADYAMYRVKHTVKGNIGEFDYSSYKRNSILLNGSEALNRLIDKKLLKYALQPIVSAKDGSIYGYEMLMRPQIEDFNSPAEVLRLAAAQSKLHIIEEITIVGGLRTFYRLVKEGQIGDTEKVFINSIGNQTLRNESIQGIEGELGEILDRVVLELTEEERTKGQGLNKKASIIRKWGAMIAIDDYGTGYNREAILMEIAPHIVKIDISFIHGVDTDENRKKLIQSMMMYAKERNISVLAEGVETRGEMEAMINLGVDYLQGYYIGRPEFECHPLSEDVISQIVNAQNIKSLNSSGV